MRILISNDDGLKFPGLLRLRERLEAFGETWVFAPAEEKSATSMALSIHTDVPVIRRRAHLRGRRVSRRLRQRRAAFGSRAPVRLLRLGHQ
jgi:5'/3'-nucleotidase SurE